MGNSRRWGKRCSARVMSAVLTAGMLMSQISVDVMASEAALESSNPEETMAEGGSLGNSGQEDSGSQKSSEDSQGGSGDEKDESSKDSSQEGTDEASAGASDDEDGDDKENDGENNGSSEGSEGASGSSEGSSGNSGEEGATLGSSDDLASSSASSGASDAATAASSGSSLDDKKDSDKYDGEISENGGKISNDYLEVSVGKYGEINSLKIVGDAYDTNYVMNSSNAPSQNTSGHEWMGELMLATKSGEEGSYRDERTANSGDIRTIYLDDENDKITVVYDPADKEEAGSKEINDLLVVETYQLVDDKLKWDITLENISDSDITVGDLGLPLPFNEFWTRGDQIYETRAVDHSFVGQNGSYIYVTRPSGQGSMLLMTPDQETDAGFEYQDHWRTNERESYERDWCQDQSGWQNGLNVFYIHSDNIKKTGRGYLPNTSLSLEAGGSKTYSFNLQSVTDEDDLGSTLYSEGLIDAVAVPGMTFAKDMPAKMYLHTKADPEEISIDIKNPEELDLYSGKSNTVSSVLPSRGDASMTYEKTVEISGEKYHVYNLKFSDLGQHNVEVSWNGKKTTFQFYIMDDIDVALDTHSNFMVEKTQLDLPGQTGDKVFDDWMMDQKTTRSNVEPDYFNMSYWGWGDDWGLTHGTFLAEKNVYQPNAAQVMALDEYLDTAIWNGLMQEHHNDYLIHDFLMNEPNASPTYRGYAYPHIYNTYFMMYKIAEKYPDLIDYKESADTYLMRAYNIFNALYNGNGVAYNWGTGVMGESTTPAIIEALRAEGHESEAQNIEALMDRKYSSFKSQKYPYGSEYSYDNTGEEAVYVLAKMQLENGNDTANASRMLSAIDLKTRACRGTQPVWYEYSVPVTNCGENWWQFQYSMSLIGYCMDDYIRYQDNGLSETDKAKAQRLSYAAKLGNLTCINSGQIDADPENIGASAWTYQAEMGNLGGQGTGGGKLHNGWRQMTGESDLGLFGAVQILSSDVAEDPIFGLFGYGCEVSKENGYYNVIPLDGLYTKLNFINEELYIELERDQYTRASVSENKDAVNFTIKNLEQTEHESDVKVYGLAEGNYILVVDGASQCGFTVASANSEVTVPVKLSGSETQEVEIIAGTFEGTVTVNAGEDKTVDIYDEFKLSGTITNTANASEKVTGTWTVKSAPEESNPVIETPDNLSTYVTFDKAGVYVFTLTASTGESDDVEITVTEGKEIPEVVANYTFDNISGRKLVNEVEGGTASELVGNYKIGSGKDETTGLVMTGNSSNGYVRLNGAILKRLSNSTISTDIKLSDSQAVGASIISLKDSKGGKIALTFENGNELMFTAGNVTTGTGVAISKDYWKNIALSLDGTTAVIYIDGVKKWSKECDVKLGNFAESGSYYLGRGTNQTDAFFNGVIDNFRLYSIAMDEEKAKSLFGTDEEITVKEVGAGDVVTPVGKMPKLPEKVKVLYSNGLFEKAAVTWDEIDPESYAKAGVFTVEGTVADCDIKATVTVMVVNGTLVNLAENATPSAIYENRNDLGGCPTLNDGYEPRNSGDTSHGAWHNWGGNNGAEAWVQYTWSDEQIITGTDAYYFRDGNGNFNPASVAYYYLGDDKKTWMSFTNVEGLGVELNKYNTTSFSPVKTTAIKMVMNPKNLGSGVIEWKVYGYGDALSAAKQNLKSSIKAYKLVKNTHVTEGFDVLKTAIAAAEEALAKETATDEELNAADNAMKEAFNALKVQDDNLAFIAQLSASYTSGWESLPAVNDGNLPKSSAVSSYGHWGTWGNTSSEESLTYLWPTEVTFNLSNLYLWYDGSEIDNGGIKYPAGMTYEIVGEDGKWVKIAEVKAEELVVDDFTANSFDKLTTSGIRVTFTKLDYDHNGVGVHEWQILNKEPEDKGTITSRYGKYYLVTKDGTKLTGLREVDGNYCYFRESDGAMIKNDYVEISGNTYYFDKNGHMVTGFMDKWGATYYFDESGIKMMNKLVKVGDYTYYFNKRGAMAKSDLVKFEDGTRYFDKEGHMAVNCTITRWFKKYTFDENGLLIK